MDETPRLVQAAQQGDRDAFGALYALYARMVHGIVLSNTTSLDVDDVVQDVFLHALKRLTSLREPAAFGGWLAAIARSRAIDQLRRRRPTETLPEELPGPPVDAPDGTAVLAAIRSLTPAYHETLTLRLVEGMTGQEIAHRTGLTEASVRVNLCRGMKQLRDLLEKKEPDER